jgi:hypothetical protein
MFNLRFPWSSESTELDDSRESIRDSINASEIVYRYGIFFDLDVVTRYVVVRLLPILQ